ncbi:MAG: hypothetical protein DWQ29_00435 [Planctomycetota bacterium]|nr:MAG: hypothetical protein DWQ29_00435 [Planctomycetota bacterium]
MIVCVLLRRNDLNNEAHLVARPAMPKPVHRSVRIIRTITCVCWAALFLATHLPVEKAMEQVPASDKQLHFAAYGLLGCLLAFWNVGEAIHRDRRVRLHRSAKRVAGIVGVLCAYGAIDELLQIPVGRSAEWLDWLADAGGAIVGATVGEFLRTRFVRSAIDEPDSER